MLNNKMYVGLMKSICKNHKQLGLKKYAVFVNGAAPDPNVYLQHVLNKMGTFSGKFMLIQAIDSGYPTQADQIIKEARGAFLILENFKSQDEVDHIKVITECELLAEELIGMLNSFFKKKHPSTRDYWFSTNEVTMESVSLIGDNKSGVRVDFVIRNANSEMLSIKEDNWIDISDIGFPA